MKYTSTFGITASGSMDGLTASHNRYGQYFRRRAIPVNPSSSGQVAVRNFFAILSAAWSSVLTQAQRDSWIAFAANVPSSGQLITGINWYIASNVLRLQSSLSRVDQGPSIFTLATLTIPTPTAATGNTSHAFSVVNPPNGWVTLGGGIAVFQSAPQNPTHTFFKGPYRFAGAILGAAVPPTSPSVITNPFAAVSGQKIFYKYVAMYADGRISSPQFVSDIV